MLRNWSCSIKQFFEKPITVLIGLLVLVQIMGLGGLYWEFPPNGLAVFVGLLCGHSWPHLVTKVGVSPILRGEKKFTPIVACC